MMLQAPKHHSAATAARAPAPAEPAQAPPLLSLPPACLLAVFEALNSSLADAVALSLCCKELWELGAAARSRHLCCAACGHAVLDPAVAYGSETRRHAPRLELMDGWSIAVDRAALLGPSAACAARLGAGSTSAAATNAAAGPGAGTMGGPAADLPGARLGPEAPMDASPVLFCLRSALGVRRAGDPGYEVRAREVLCGNPSCGLHLGLTLVQLGTLREDSTAACISNWRELQLLGTCYLAKLYLRLRRPNGADEHLGRPPPPTALAPYRCTAARSRLRKLGACGAELFDPRDILVRQHCWDAGDGPEHANFINSFRPGAVEVRNERQEALCQGDMRVADVYCATCSARIGWKFCADLSPALENCNQVGRYGVVCSSITT